MKKLIKKNFFVKTYLLIKLSMPGNYFKGLYKNIFAAVARSVLDLLGIFMLIPVLKIVMDKESITEKSGGYIRWLYQFFDCSSREQLALIIMSCVVVVFFVKTLLSWIIIKYQNRFFAKVAEDISMGVYLSYLNESYDFHINNNTGILVRNFITVPFDFMQRILMPFISLISEMLVIIIILVVMLFYQPMVLVFLILFILPFVYFYYRFTELKLSKLSIKRDTQGKKYYTQSFQDMNFFREIVLFKRFEYFKTHYHQKLNEIVKNIRSLNMLNDISLKIIELVGVFGIFSIFVASFILHKTGNLAEILVFFVIALSRIIPSLNKTIAFINTIKSTEYAYKYLDSLPKDINAARPSRIELKATRTLRLQSKIAVRDLCFQYPAATKPTFDKINFEIYKGETVGIVGPSGSGKTTMLNILLRLFQESDGGLYVDNEKITVENLSAWYDLIGYVPQNIMITDASMLENIAFGIEKEDIDMEQVKRVVTQAKLDDLVRDAEKGLDTQIGEAGLKISGGQRQRIGIARALYIKPQVLIFDEATSALDTQTEEAITESIRELSHKDMTIIIVAHRVPTLKYCDRIIELEDGKVKREVTYEELSSQS